MLDFVTVNHKYYNVLFRLFNHNKAIKKILYKTSQVQKLIGFFINTRLINKLCDVDKTINSK